MKYLFTQIALVATLIANSQTLKREENHYNDAKIEASDFRLVLVDCNSQENDYIKSKIKLTNKSNYPILVKLEYCNFTNSNGGTFNSAVKNWLLVMPNNADTKVVKASAMGEKVNTGKMLFNLDGMYSCQESIKNPVEEIVVKVRKKTTSGNFKCTIDDIDWRDDICVVECVIKYYGENIGVFSPSQVSVKSDNGNKSFHKDKKDEIGVFHSLKNGEEVREKLRFVIKSAKKSVLQLNEALVEYIPTTKLEKSTVELFVDSIKTTQANKTLIRVLKDFAK